MDILNFIIKVVKQIIWNYNKFTWKTLNNLDALDGSNNFFIKFQNMNLMYLEKFNKMFIIYIYNAKTFNYETRNIDYFSWGFCLITDRTAIAYAAEERRLKHDNQDFYGINFQKLNIQNFIGIIF